METQAAAEDAFCRKLNWWSQSGECQIMDPLTMAAVRLAMQQLPRSAHKTDLWLLALVATKNCSSAQLAKLTPEFLKGFDISVDFPKQFSAAYKAVTDWYHSNSRRAQQRWCCRVISVPNAHHPFFLLPQGYAHLQQELLAPPVVEQMKATLKQLAQKERLLRGDCVELSCINAVPDEVWEKLGLLAHPSISGLWIEESQLRSQHSQPPGPGLHDENGIFVVLQRQSLTASNKKRRVSSNFDDSPEFNALSHGLKAEDASTAEPVIGATSAGIEAKDKSPDIESSAISALKGSKRRYAGKNPGLRQADGSEGSVVVDATHVANQVDTSPLSDPQQAVGNQTELNPSACQTGDPSLPLARRGPFDSRDSVAVANEEGTRSGEKRRLTAPASIIKSELPDPDSLYESVRICAELLRRNQARRSLLLMPADDGNSKKFTIRKVLSLPEEQPGGVPNTPLLTDCFPHKAFIPGPRCFYSPVVAEVDLQLLLPARPKQGRPRRKHPEAVAKAVEDAAVKESRFLSGVAAFLQALIWETVGISSLRLLVRTI